MGDRTSLPVGFYLVDVGEDRYEEWLDRFLGAFDFAPEGDETMVDFFRSTHPHDRVIAISDKGDFVATAGAIDVPLFLPGGGVVEMAGVGAVTVDPTATRQGLLRCMMNHLHRRARDEGRPVMGLPASEWAIYERFGYGAASWLDSLTIEARAVGWRDDAPGHDLRPRRIPGDEARDLGERLHSHQARMTPGEVLPPARYWDRFTMAPSYGRLDEVFHLSGRDAGRRHCVAIEDRGLAAYRIKADWAADGTPNNVLQVTDLLAVDAEAAAALWRHILTVDLVAQVHVSRVPTDDPITWWVTDARRLAPRRHDGLWLRPLDVPSLLEARGWSGQGVLTVTVHDRDGFTDGTFRLEVEDGRGSCVRTTGEADLEMDVASLGAILLGGTPARGLAQSGRIHAPDHRSAQLWDALATPERAPFIRYLF